MGKNAHSGLAYDPDTANENCIGNMRKKCQYCNALKWKGETPGMCCSSGKVELRPMTTPPKLYSLLMGNRPEHRHVLTIMVLTIEEKIFVVEHYFRSYGVGRQNGPSLRHIREH